MEKMIWLPRGLFMFVIALVALFSLDSFGNGLAWWEQLLSFVIHNIPTIVLGALLALSWKRPVLAGWLLIGVTAVMIWKFGTRWDIIAYLLLGGVPALTGLLFIICGKRV